MIQAADASSKEVKKRVRDDLRKVGDIVRVTAQLDFISAAKSASDERSRIRTASGFRTVVRRTGVVSVEQRLPKTTGLHPKWGGVQMREALIPALESNEEKVAHQMQDTIDRLASDFAKRR